MEEKARLLTDRTEMKLKDSYYGLGLLPKKTINSLSRQDLERYFDFLNKPPKIVYLAQSTVDSLELVEN